MERSKTSKQKRISLGLSMKLGLTVKSVALKTTTGIKQTKPNFRDSSLVCYTLMARVSDWQLEKVSLNLACAPKQGTLSHLLYLWTDM